MSSPFDQAEIYIKEVLAIAIEMAVRDINQELDRDKQIPELKLIVTGGQAIQAYFPNSPPLRTHDFDLKLIAPSKIIHTSLVKERMVTLGKGIVKYIEIIINKYITDMLDSIRDNIKNNSGIELIVNEEGSVFTASTNLRHKQLNTVIFRMKSDDTIRTNSICDVFVVNPDDIYHYHTFTGDSESEPILSSTGGDYYIPINEINGIPFAGLGYLVWDTQRMVIVSQDEKLPKHNRYVEKRNAIIAALNDPLYKLSCNSMKDFMVKCEKEYKTCYINDQKLEGVNALLRYAISEGVVPPEPGVIKRIQETYDSDYLCSMIKRILE